MHVRPPPPRPPTRNSQRLDCAVMHVSCIQAGLLLARMGRPEVTNCISGLEQYAYAYEECADQAAEIKRIYHQAVAGELDIAGTGGAASTNSRATSTDPGPGPGPAAANAMTVDQPVFGGGAFP
ncbi:hypothetical protein GSI_15536 [Ganoderma sinense ZZ0214-1]|uniref:Uncharacterized protein n=1 Tax=Ganoderma sinense ZZ0214-1 TaxID=1077348 RepID=A0A2G8RMW8_9APHY|nr:hypothetical protein GSI_15536 [Ganoderma sinense ZZ0214-1]